MISLFFYSFISLFPSLDLAKDDITSQMLQSQNASFTLTTILYGSAQ